MIFNLKMEKILLLLIIFIQSITGCYFNGKLESYYLHGTYWETRIPATRFPEEQRILLQAFYNYQDMEITNITLTKFSASVNFGEKIVFFDLEKIPCCHYHESLEINFIPFDDYDKLDIQMFLLLTPSIFTESNKEINYVNFEAQIDVMGHNNTKIFDYQLNSVVGVVKLDHV